MVFTTNVTPQTQLNVRSSAQQVAPDTQEVTLTITVEAKDKDSTLFLAEVAQSGIFVIQGYSAEEQSILIGSFCPNTLYPFAREAISDLVSKGGFPPLLLQPLNFDAIYAQAVQERAARAQRRPAKRRPRQRPARRISTASRIAIVGAGSWGTALAVQFARAGHPAALWARDAAHVAAMQRERRNTRYLPDTAFPETARRHGGSRRGRRARPTTCSSPYRATRCARLLTALAGLPLRRLAWATKGFELDTGLLPYQVAGQLLPASLPTAVLSGPTFAREVGAGLPTAMTIASARRGLRAAPRRAHQQRNLSRLHLERRRRRRGRRRDEERLRDRRRHLRRPGLRREHAHRADCARPRRDDAAGARARRTQGDVHGPRGHGRPRAHVHGRPFAQPPLRARARRRREPQEALRSIGQVVEGYNGARAVQRVAEQHKVPMPIVEQVYRVLHEGADPRAAVAALMRRPISSELG